MKTLEFETSKGRFLLVDNPLLPQAMSITTKYIKLSEITEEQASEIVDSDDEYGVIMYQNYQTASMQYFDEQITAIESLHSLLKSKGILEQKTFYNPYIFKI